MALATNAFTNLLRRLGNYIVPVYDYVLVTEPLSPEQQDAVGWEGRQGLADLGNQFHYYRLTADNRILWGGYDVIYHFGNRIRAEQDQRLATHAALAEQFFTTFPQLEGLRFTHRWGGVIDTCSRFTTFWGRAYRDRLENGAARRYAAGSALACRRWQSADRPTAKTPATRAPERGTRLADRTTDPRRRWQRTPRVAPSAR